METKSIQRRKPIRKRCAVSEEVARHPSRLPLWQRPRVHTACTAAHDGSEEKRPATRRPYKHGGWPEYLPAYAASSTRAPLHAPCPDVSIHTGSYYVSSAQFPQHEAAALRVLYPLWVWL